VVVVASLSQGRTAAAQCGLLTHKSVPGIFEPPCIYYHQITSLFSEHQADGICLYQCIVASVSGSCHTRASVGPHQ